MEDDNIYEPVEYQFPLGYRCIWLEEILKEFKIETHTSWCKDGNDWTVGPIYKQEEPENPEFWSIVYTCIPEPNNFNHEFAEILIEDSISCMAYLESCLRKEMEE